MSDEKIEALLSIVAKIERQADCLEGYAEQSGFEAKPIPSAFHWQATHFRDYAKELRDELTRNQTPPEVEGLRIAFMTGFERGQYFEQHPTIAPDDLEACADYLRALRTPTTKGPSDER